MPAQITKANGVLSKKLPGILGIINDGVAKRGVLEALSDPAVGRINFRVNGFAITPQHFARAREKVESGAIRVSFDAALRDPRTQLPFCVYRTDSNAMTLGFNTVSGLNEKALMLHEATHAACDVAGYSTMITIDSEIMAYVAQAIYLTVKLGSLPLQADPIIAGSQLLAEIILGGRILTPADLVSISQAILHHPDYLGKATRLVGYDGVN